MRGGARSDGLAGQLHAGTVRDITFLSPSWASALGCDAGLAGGLPPIMTAAEDGKALVLDGEGSVRAAITVADQLFALAVSPEPLERSHDYQGWRGAARAAVAEPPPRLRSVWRHGHHARAPAPAGCGRPYPGVPAPAQRPGVAPAVLVQRDEAVCRV